jgi:hypothetical protein
LAYLFQLKVFGNTVPSFKNIFVNPLQSFSTDEEFKAAFPRL